MSLNITKLDNASIIEIIRVMIIDDQEQMRDVLSVLLKKEGIREITQANNALEALKTIENSDNPPDVILCDIHMEGMDGLEFCQKVRMSKNPRIKDLRVIIITGDHDPLLHEISAQVGASAVLRKPVTSDILKHHIAKAVDLAL